MSHDPAAAGHWPATGTGSHDHDHGQRPSPWSRTTTPRSAIHIHPRPWNPLFRYVFSTDHKVIAIQFLFSGLIFFVVGGLMAMAIRWQLAWPWSPMPVLSKALWSAQGYRMPPEFYNKLFTMHGSIMIFLVVIPILVGTFGNLTIPLMIGARDMAFPRLNMVSDWCMPFAFVAIMNSWSESGWTSYPTLANSLWSTPGSFNGQTWWLIGVLFAGVSSLLGSINYLTTILMLRAPGMKMFRLPMTVWAMFITSILQAFALPVLTSALVMQLLDRTAGTNFFTPAGLSVANGPAAIGGGQPLLWQHLFWFYSHPAVYIMILPASVGIVSDVISTFSPQAPVRLQADGASRSGRSRGWGSSSGATTCSSRA